MINLGFTFQCLWCASKPFGRLTVSANEKPGEAPPPDGDNDAASGEDAPKKKGLGLIPMIAGAVVVAGVAGGAAFVLTPGAKHEDPACLESAGEEGAHGEAAPAEECVAEDHGGKGKKPEKKSADKGHGGGGHGGDSGSSNVKPLGEVQHTDYATFVVLDPMVVSISPIGRSKHLKISLVLETDDDGAAELLDHGFYIQDVLNTFLRSVDNEVLEDPAAMSRLRAQILRRVRAIVPDANIQNVLITEFVLT